MTSSRLNPKAMVKTISNLTGLHPKGVAHLESMRSASLERGLIPPCLLVNLVLVLLLALPLVLHLVSFAMSIYPFGSLRYIPLAWKSGPFDNR